MVRVDHIRHCFTITLLISSCVVGAVKAGDAARVEEVFAVINSLEIRSEPAMQQALRGLLGLLEADRRNHLIETQKLRLYQDLYAALQSGHLVNLASRYGRNTQTLVAKLYHRVFSDDHERLQHAAGNGLLAVTRHLIDAKAGHEVGNVLENLSTSLADLVTALFRGGALQRHATSSNSFESLRRLICEVPQELILHGRELGISQSSVMMLASCRKRLLENPQISWKLSPHLAAQREGLIQWLAGLPWRSSEHLDPAARDLLRQVFFRLAAENPTFTEELRLLDDADCVELARLLGSIPHDLRDGSALAETARVWWEATVQSRPPKVTAAGWPIAESTGLHQLVRDTLTHIGAVLSETYPEAQWRVHLAFWLVVENQENRTEVHALQQLYDTRNKIIDRYLDNPATIGRHSFDENDGTAKRLFDLLFNEQDDNRARVLLIEMAADRHAIEAATFFAHRQPNGDIGVFQIGYQRGAIRRRKLHETLNNNHPSRDHLAMLENYFEEMEGGPQEDYIERDAVKVFPMARLEITEGLGGLPHVRLHPDDRLAQIERLVNDQSHWQKLQEIVHNHFGEKPPSTRDAKTTGMILGALLNRWTQSDVATQRGDASSAEGNQITLREHRALLRNLIDFIGLSLLDTNALPEQTTADHINLMKRNLMALQESSAVDLIGLAMVLSGVRTSTRLSPTARRNAADRLQEIAALLEAAGGGPLQRYLLGIHTPADAITALLTHHFMRQPETLPLSKALGQTRPTGLFENLSNDVSDGLPVDLIDRWRTLHQQPQFTELRQLLSSSRPLSWARLLPYLPPGR